MAGGGGAGGEGAGRLHGPLRLAALLAVVLVFAALDALDLGLLAHPASPAALRLRLRSAGDGALAQPARAAAKELLWRGAPWKASVGEWLQRCGGTSELVVITETLHAEQCPNACSGNGVCNRELGECRCRSGFKGSDCAELDELECNYKPIRNATQELAPWVVSACLAFCDKQTAMCRCGPDTPYPMRPIVEQCGTIQLSGGVIWTQQLLDDLFSPDPAEPGWCFASPRGRARPRKYCGCPFDGQAGDLCEIATQPYCVNGCSRHGTCNNGYCQCEEAWYGIDCSVPSASSPREGDLRLPWLEGDSAFPLKPVSNIWESLKNVLFSTSKGSQYRVERRRPLIYVYDLPVEFNFHHLQGRLLRDYCVPWMYNAENMTEFVWHQLYGMELIIYESLLSSVHRTTNGDEADYFYVPVLSGCIISRADETPRMNMQGKFKGVRPYFSSDFILRSHAYISREHPYWNRSGGRDHLWVFPWDEGACYAPQAIRSSIMLSPWGNTMASHKHSTTAYRADNWDVMPRNVRGNHSCFDPDKDLVMPAWKPPNLRHIENRFWNRPFEERRTLFYFNGNLGADHGDRPEPEYSMGIRQKVAAYFASTPNIQGKLGLKAEDGVIVTNLRSDEYGEQLSSSRFCGVFPGDGFSARMEDSMLHGCIPVIIQDGIQMAYENLLDFSSFTVRVAEADIPNMIEILKGIPEERVRAMLVAIRTVWQRWSYLSGARLEARRQREWYGHNEMWAQKVEELRDDDAVATLLQALHYKLHNDPWRRARRDVERDLGVPQECRTPAQNR